MSLLFTLNNLVAKIIYQILKLKASHPEHKIKSIRMDNVDGFSSHAFNN